eukprot:COSAG01_NODE_11379_length_1948_cov_5.157923_2_plen_172_part_01
MVAAQRRRRPTQSLPAAAAVAAALAAAAGVASPEAAPCTIARVPVAELSAEEFLTRHRHRHPLLLSGMTDGWRARARWSWEFLTSAASNASGAVNVGTGASLAASGMASARPTLSRFVQQHVKVENPQHTVPAIRELLSGHNARRLGELVGALTGAEWVQIWHVQLLGKPST